ncbi:siroheme synthase [Photobacterium sp. MCCC 1A19761]|uniref:precorrin-2 dehydrogenase/sirohydrochlorin ferrochelatase family protein n=1 Tax=Photobacterium sp. MCCC 1A19761 TaxID=3115000 RepID=UPI00307F7F07
MDFFPVFLKLNDRKVIVIGGGEVACRKIDLLYQAGACITLVSPAIHPYLSGLVEENNIAWLQQSYQKDVLSGFHQVWATTDDPALNHQIFKDANSLGLWTNVVDDPQHCHFITPAMVDRSPIQVAISSGGASPVLVRMIREKLETQLPQNLSLLAEYSGQQRQRIKQFFSTVDERRKFWERFFRLPAVETATTPAQLEAAFSDLLEQPNPVGGCVYLIETGVDPELLSLKALRLMQQAEYVLYPQASAQSFIELCRRDAERDNYEPDTLVNQISQWMQEDYRVCVLLPKPISDQMAASLAEQFQGIFVPCVG